MAGEVPHGGPRAIMSPVGKGKKWERVSVEGIFNIQIKLSVNRRLRSEIGSIVTEFYDIQNLVFKQA